MQMHLDFAVPSVEELQRQRDRAQALGAQLLLDRTDEEDEPLYVLADPPASVLHLRRLSQTSAGGRVTGRGCRRRSP